MSRDFRQARIDELAANFDPEPTVNIRMDGDVWIIDGQHRNPTDQQAEGTS